MKIKLVFLISDFNYGGAQRQLITLVKAIDKEKFDISVLYYYPDCPLEKDLQEANVTTICIEKKGRKDFFGFYRLLVLKLKKIQPDIIHSYLGMPNLFAIAVKPFFPFTKIVWGIRGSDNGDVIGSAGSNSLLWQSCCFFSRFTDLVIANSNAGKDYYLANNFPKDRTIVVPNGIDTKRFRINPEARAKIRSEWEISPETILIGLVGRIHPMKDHPTFFQGAAIVSQKRKNIQFVCVGTGEEKYKQKLQQLAQQLGLEERLIWTGARKDIPAVNNALDISVSVSACGEGFSNVLGESMACGVSCVATDVGDSAWIIGDDGIIVPPKNSQALAEAMEQVIEKENYKSDRHKEYLRQKIIDNFSVSQLANRTETALSKLVTQSSHKNN